MSDTEPRTHICPAPQCSEAFPNRLLLGHHTKKVHGAALAELRAAADVVVDPDPAGNGLSADDLTEPSEPPPDRLNELVLDYSNPYREKENGDTPATAGPPPRVSRRRQSMRRRDASLLSQIRTFGRDGVTVTGAWAYYIRPDGATVREALILYPNGGAPQVPNDTGGRRSKLYANNANYYRARQQAKGYTFVGETLTRDGIKLLLETIEGNKEEELLWIDEEIADATAEAEVAPKPEVKAQAQSRIRQLTERREMIEKPIDGETLARELDEIRQAQALAQLPDDTRRALAALVDQMNDNVKALAAGMASGRGAMPVPDELAGRARFSRSGFEEAELGV